MAKKSITVFNSAHDGYYRAGIRLNKGDNIVDGLSGKQIQQITNDPRLVLQNADKAESDDKTQLVAGNNGASEYHLSDQDIAKVIHRLKLDGSLDLTKSGKPSVEQLEDETFDRITAKQRDSAWAWYNDNPDHWIVDDAESAEA